MKTTIAILVLMASCVWMMPDAALGQTRTPDEAEAPAARSGTQSLPEWARPSDPYASTKQGIGESGTVQPNAPTLPPPGSRVPVDGGLGWLAVAGAAYAVSRLRKNDDEGADNPPTP